MASHAPKPAAGDGRPRELRFVKIGARAVGIIEDELDARGAASRARSKAMIGRDHSRLRGKVALAPASWLDPSGYDACKKVKGLKRHVLVLLNLVVHPADIQNRDRGCAGRYDYSRSIERIFANDADAGRKKAMAAIIIRPPLYEPHHDQLMPSVDPDLLLSKFDWTQLDTCRVSE